MFVLIFGLGLSNMREKNGHVRNGLYWVVLLIGCLFAPLTHAAIEATPVGNWIKLDPITKEPGAIIQITESADDTLTGKVTKIFDPANNKTTCTDCPEAFKNKPIIGMEVLWGVKQASDYTWTEGHLLSPKRGKVFSCNVTLSHDGQTLTIRVYSMSALLGHTENWYRA